MNKFKTFLNDLSDFELQQFRIFNDSNKDNVRQMLTNNACSRIFKIPVYEVEVKKEFTYSIREAKWE
jgi:hypothetical protein